MLLKKNDDNPGIEQQMVKFEKVPGGAPLSKFLRAAMAQRLSGRAGELAMSCTPIFSLTFESLLHSLTQQKKG